MFYSKYIKRIIDIVLSFIGLIVLLPVYFIIFLLIKFDSKGPAFFKQKRIKCGKKTFNILKFRTMYVDTPKNMPTHMLENPDMYITRTGKFLRKFSLDELPQIFNIFKGDMSFVGPRPLLVKYLPLYSEEQRHRHDVRPGLTGYAQAHGRNSITWEEKFIMDVWYTRNISFKTDLKIISDTIKTVLRQEGIDFNSSMKVKEFTGNKND